MCLLLKVFTILLGLVKLPIDEANIKKVLSKISSLLIEFLSITSFIYVLLRISDKYFALSLIS